MNIDEPLRVISSALAPSGEQALSIDPGRWHVLFSHRPRPLLMPAAAYRLQEQCLDYFVGNRLKSLYAKALLKANSLLPAAGLLPEFRLPHAKPGALPCTLPIRQPSHAAIQIGSAGPYQKASVLLMSDRGEGLALAKIAMARSADHRILAEADWLRRFEGVRPLEGRIPRLLAEGTAANGRRYLVTTLAPSTKTTTEFTYAHGRFLRTLGRTQVEISNFGNSSCLRSMEQTLAELEPYVTRDTLAVIHAAVRDCETSLSDWTGPFVIAQGDFAPWNIRMHQKRIFVFDWEYARTGANPLADACNYFLIQRSVCGRPIGRRFLATVIRRIEHIARELYPEWKWHSRVVATLTLAYLLEVLLCYSRAARNLDLAHPVIDSYWKLIRTRSAWMVQ